MSTQEKIDQSHAEEAQPSEVEIDATLLDQELENLLKKDKADAFKFHLRKKRLQRIVFWARVVVLAVLVISCVGVWGFFNWRTYVTDFDKYGSDTRTCIFKVGERTVNGTRSYAYRYTTVLGHRIFMTPESEVKHETRLDITGNGMTILMQTPGEEPKKKIIGDGEKYRQLLDRAETYTFFMDGGKNTAILSYNEICR